MSSFMNGSEFAMPALLRSNYPLDAKTIASTVEEVFQKLPIYSRYEGLEVYITSLSKHYAFIGGIEDSNFIPSRPSMSPNVPDWSYNNSYNKNEIIMYNGNLYRVKNSIDNSVFTPDIDVSNFEAVSSNINEKATLIFPPFVANYSYEFGEVVRYNEVLYIAKKSFVSGSTFNIVDWDLATGDLKSSVYDLDNDGIIDKSKYSDTSGISLETSKISEWKPNVNYTGGQQVVYLNKIYSVISNHTSPSIFNDTNLQLMSTSNHNELLNLLGGDSAKKEYYHLDGAKNTIINNITEDGNGILNYNGVQLGDMSKSTYDKSNNGVVDRAETLDGMITTVDELNYAKGLKGNIQSQIDLLTGVANFTQTVPTKAGLDSIVGGKEKDMVIVTNDESHGDVTTVYVHNGTSFQYVSPFTATVRDFATNPIQLGTESIGIITENRIDSAIARKTDIQTLSNYALVNTYTQTDTNLTDAVNKKHAHLNQTLLDGYNQTNADITKAVQQTHTHTNGAILDSFSESLTGRLLYKGLAIGDGGGTSIGNLDVRQVILYNIVATSSNPYIKEIDILTTNNYPILPVNVLRIVAGAQNTISILAEFLSTESKDFNSNNYIIFDGMLKLKTIYTSTVNKTSTVGESSLYEVDLDLNNYKNITSMEVM